MKTTVGALILASLMFVATVNAYPVTQTFGTSNYHITPEFDNVAKGGIASGFFVFGSLMLFAWVRIWVDEYQRQSEYNKNLRDDLAEMRRLDIDIAKVDEEYNRINSKKKNMRIEDIDAAAEEQK